jgi:hypothetical protein
VDANKIPRQRWMCVSGVYRHDLQEWVGEEIALSLDDLSVLAMEQKDIAPLCDALYRATLITEAFLDEMEAKVREEARVRKKEDD